ncbi:hypothetical protein F5Y19DRAFT_350776 [Xylariaceae sp. FL1651]|nr:hypothetical protein F5Y19DRAFT_350776 [Xylariaceae sp. FL1651]
MSDFASGSKGLGAPPRPSSGRQSPTKSPFGGLYNDPRTSSTQSLTPSLPRYEEVERRKLLVVYIHGFMGNDTSFQSFPAHVHQYLKLALFDSHVIHSKVYPKYKTYKSIEIARDNFSRWLEPHEGPKTDVILVGHSMGGLLAADVVLMPSVHQQHHSYFRHRILGTVNLDSPLLGMHPGIIVSGISSLFRKNEPPKPPGEPGPQAALSPSITGMPSPSLSTYSVPSMMSEMPPSPPPPPAPFARPAFTNDPNFNPNFVNDVRLQERSWWKNVVHFVKKHNSEGLIDAATNHIMSHMEFGGTMFDINCLKTRYESVRKLEDIDDLKNSGLPHVPPQIRFIQYYTVCNGYPKKPKEQERELDASSASVEESLSKSPSTPRISIGEPGLEIQSETPIQDDEFFSLPNSERSSLEVLCPQPMSDEPPPIPGDNSFETQHTEDSKLHEQTSISTQASGHENLDPTPGQSSAEDKVATAELTDAVASLYLDLAAVPELPPKPDPPNLEQYTDKDARRQAEKEAKRVQKAYDQAVKDREKAIKEREKIIEKRKKKRAQEAEKKAKEEKKQRKKEEAAAVATAAAAAAAVPAAATSLVAPADPETSPPTPAQEAKENISALSNPVSRPSLSDSTLISSELVPEGANAKSYKENAKGKEKHKTEKEEKRKERKFCNVPKSHGQVDSKWIKVFMKDMDEVAAHTGLFFSGDHYEKLVGDVGNTIVEWVHEDMTKRIVLEIQ